jgi:hypothetical protein
MDYLPFQLGRYLDETLRPVQAFQFTVSRLSLHLWAGC